MMVVQCFVREWEKETASASATRRHRRGRRRESKHGEWEKPSARLSAMRSASSSDVGLGVHIAVGAGVSRIVCAVGFGARCGTARTSGRRPACSLSPTLPLSTIGVADTVKTTKSLRLPTI